MANGGNNTIEKFTPGGVGSVFASTGLNGPNGLAFDSAGNLYAAISAISTIEKFTPGGVGSLFASTGLDAPQYLAFTTDAGVPLALPPGPAAVPEPGSFLCGAGVLALIGYSQLLSRQRRRPVPARTNLKS